MVKKAEYLDVVVGPLEWYYYIVPLLCAVALIFLAYRNWSELKNAREGSQIVLNPIWRIGVLAVISGIIGTAFRFKWVVGYMREQYEERTGMHSSFQVPDTVIDQFQNALIPVTIGLGVLLLSLMLWAIMKRMVQ